MAGLGDDEVAAAADHPDRLGLHDRLVAAGVARVDLGHGVLGLRHDLLGDHHHVAVTQVGLGCRDQPRKITGVTHLLPIDVGHNIVGLQAVLHGR